MLKYGGSFVKALAQCVILADPENLERLKDAFPGYFVKYESLAAKMINEGEMD
jgi:hypothetical protein